MVLNRGVSGSVRFFGHGGQLRIDTTLVEVPGGFVGEQAGALDFGGHDFPSYADVFVDQS